ncbi:MAG: DNA-processing protein DprA [Candidatus Kapabacteria bacterium]|nr:DNA-processing protein DprA [Candidatus Kapabacteria bacterium]
MVRIVSDFKSLNEMTESSHPIRNKVFADDLFASGNHYYDESMKQIEHAEKNKSKFVTLWDSEYPTLLKSIAYPPPILFVKGTLQASDSIAIAIVGTRRPSTYGKLCAERFADYFALNNVVVVSGLAYGIDTIAHMTTVKGNGITYAVIASGIDKLSPSTSVTNSDKIIETGGAIISEYKFGISANLSSFPQRNRIIAGVSKAVLIVESAAKGGSLITARIAFNEGRDVFAIPGNINNKTSDGTNDLIRAEAAKIALSPQQILQDLGFDKVEFEAVKKAPVFSNKSAELLYSLLSYEPLHIDALLQKSELDISMLLVLLLELEFNGHIRQLPGKYYILNN